MEQLGSGGDVKCRADLECYLTKTLVKSNMITKTAAGHTVFEGTTATSRRQLAIGF